MSTAPTLASSSESFSCVTVLWAKARSEARVEEFLDEVDRLASDYGKAQFFAIATPDRVFAVFAGAGDLDRFLLDNCERAITSVSDMLDRIDREDDQDLVFYRLWRKANLDDALKNLAQWMSVVASAPAVVLDVERTLAQEEASPEQVVVGLSGRSRPGVAKTDTTKRNDVEKAPRDRDVQNNKGPSRKKADAPWDDTPRQSTPVSVESQEVDEVSVLAVFEKTFGR